MEETLTLGELIRQLKEVKPDVEVDFDFAGTYPTTLDSWRGRYAELALGFDGGHYNDKQSGAPQAKDLILELESAIGKTFEGWKGGDFLMKADTQVWVNNPGMYSRTRIVNVSHTEFSATINTANLED